MDASDGGGAGDVPPQAGRDLIAYMRKHRKGPPGAPFEIVFGGASPADSAEARDTIATLADAGATGWYERQLQSSDDLYRQMPVLRRIDKGPPSL
jgi:hypothetical protein